MLSCRCHPPEKPSAPLAFAAYPPLSFREGGTPWGTYLGLAALGFVRDPLAKVSRKYPSAPMLFMGGLIGAFLLIRYPIAPWAA